MLGDSLPLLVGTVSIGVCTGALGHGLFIARDEKKGKIIFYVGLTYFLAPHVCKVRVSPTVTYRACFSKQNLPGLGSSDHLRRPCLSDMETASGLVVVPTS